MTSNVNFTRNGKNKHGSQTVAQREFQTCVRQAENRKITQIIKYATPIQQKGRRIPKQLQEWIEKEPKILMNQNHINKLSKYSDRQFFSLIVVTVKKDQTVKLDLESRMIKKLIHNKKYQMPNIKLLLDSITEKIRRIKRIKSCDTSRKMKVSMQ